MGRSGELLKNTAIITVGKMGTQVINFLLLPLYTAKLSTEAYGNFDYVTTIASFLVPLMTMLMEESMFRFLIDCKSDTEQANIISNTFLFCLISSISTGVVIGVASWIFSYNLGYAILLYSIASLFISLSNAFARGTGNIGLYSLSNFLVSITVIFLNLILILVFHQGLWALILSACVANISAALFVFVKLGFWKYLNIKDFNKKIVRRMLNYSIPLVPNTISWSVINTSDRLVIMNFLGASANGLYSIAYKFPNLINTLYGFFNIAWRETSAKIVKDNDIREFDRVYKTIKYGLFSVTAVLIALIRYIYPVFINQQYQSSIVYIPILTISIYYSCLAAFYGGVFTAYKETKILGTSSTIAAVINLFIDIVLFKSIGVYAAAFSTLVSSLFMYVHRKLQMKKYFNAYSVSDIGVMLFFVVICVLFYLNIRVTNIIAVAIAVFASTISNWSTIATFIKRES